MAATASSPGMGSESLMAATASSCRTVLLHRPPPVIFSRAAPPYGTAFRFPLPLSKTQVKSLSNANPPPSPPQPPTKKRCVRCNTLYDDEDNSAAACSFHGHSTGAHRIPHPLSDFFARRGNRLSKCPGEKGLLSLAPPHQGIDGEWSDASGVIVYKWNEKGDRPNTGRANWKRRWSCCSEYGEDARPCRRGWHVSYDDGFTLF